MAGLVPGRENIDLLMGKAGGRSCHYLLHCSQITFPAVHMGAPMGDGVSRLQAKSLVCLYFTANQGVNTLRTPSDCTSLLSTSMHTY